MKKYYYVKQKYYISSKNLINWVSSVLSFYLNRGIKIYDYLQIIGSYWD